MGQRRLAKPQADDANKRPMQAKPKSNNTVLNATTTRKGEVFRAWVATLEALGYTVGWRVLRAADYGDPTTRERLFVQGGGTLTD